MSRKIKENPKYLTEQIITYLGNKRSLLSHIEKEIKKIQREIGNSKTTNLDLFSGSGIVSRMMKQYSSHIIANDLEKYSKIINMCYLSNKSEFSKEEYDSIKIEYFEDIEDNLYPGIISQNYAPKDDKNIKDGERVFYTTRNANYIDTATGIIKTLPDSMYHFFMAPLLYEASVKTNTAGMFKGFYKDSRTGVGKFGGTGEYALKRIKGKISIQEPILSNFDCEVSIFQEDANCLVKKLENIDITYIDPPYNQHPYGSNYFMLNAIIEGKIDSEISRVSGIPKNWNRSSYNVKSNALASLEDIIQNLDTKYFIISYNSEGFITYDEMCEMLSKYGELKINEIPYNTYRGSRNLSERSLYVDEYLFVLRKDQENEK